MTFTPTDSEREQASEIVSHWKTGGPSYIRNAIAQALADQRASGRSAIAEEVEAIAEALRQHGAGPEVFVVDERAEVLRSHLG